MGLGQATSFPERQRIVLWITGAALVSSAQVYSYAAGSGALLGLVLTIGALFLSPIAIAVYLQSRHQLPGRLRAFGLLVICGLGAAWIFQAIIVVYWLFFAFGSDGFL